jgi:hypothetical protein
MLGKKIVCCLLLLSFILALASPVLAVPEERKLDCVYSYLSLEDKPLAKPGKPVTTSLGIRNIPSGDTVFDKVLVIAQVTGTFTKVVFQVGSSAAVDMAKVDSTDRYEASWDTNSLSAGSYTFTIKAEDANNKQLASASVTVNVVKSIKYHLRYEIDYVTGYMPSTNVLDYMVSYWRGHAIEVTYTIDDEIKDSIATDGVISSSDFWALENKYNDGTTNSAKYGYQYTLPEKWMLYGTWDVNSNVGGYTYVAFSGKDLIGGNYIFIAGAMIDNWETINDIPSDGGKVIVTCHEAGHSIGIAVIRGISEKYDPDVYSIMSYMRLQNAKDMVNYWYYSKEYWATANLNYYL